MFISTQQFEITNTAPSGSLTSVALRGLNSISFACQKHAIKCLISCIKGRAVRQIDPCRVSWPRLTGPGHGAGILFLSLPGRKWTGPCLLPLCQCSAHIWHRAQPAPPGGCQMEHNIKISATQHVYFQAAPKFQVFLTEALEH